MQTLTLWLFVVLGVVLLVAALWATSLRDIIGSESSSAAPSLATTAPAPAPEPATGTTRLPDPGGEFGIDQLRAVFSVLDEKERARVLADKTAFSNLVRNEQARWAVIRAARQSGLDASPQIGYLMERSAEQALADAYLKMNVAAAVPADFPSEDQIRQLYEQNRSQYRVEARIPVWQIFFAIPAGASGQQVRETEARAERLVADLRAGKIAFGNAARMHSGHAASRLNGGFMGNLKVSELIPEVKSAVAEADADRILDPVRSPSGLHVLKRGETIAETQLSLDQVREQIRAALRQAAETRARQLVVSRAREETGGEPDEARLESWRAALAEAGARAP